MPSQKAPHPNLLEHDMGIIQSVSKSRYTVLINSGDVVEGIAGKKSPALACGDFVRLSPIDKKQFRINERLERERLLYRQDAYRIKLIAANFNLVAIVIANSPPFNLDLLCRLLIATEISGSNVLIIANKMDLDHHKVQEQLALLGTTPYDVLSLCALQDISPLQKKLQHKNTVLIGESGMGKSSILNALLPHVQRKTQTISKALNSGQHTTTRTERYLLPNGGSIIDCPGIQSFGLYFATSTELIEHFKEFNPALGHCRFHNCLHLKEQGCAVHKHYQDGHISNYRWNLYQRLMIEIQENKTHRK